MNKKDLSERDVCTKYITPAIEKAGWDVHTQLRENVHLTQGRVIVRGKLVSRGKAKFADYVLNYRPNLPLAIVEAKDNNHGVGDGIQQALGYADMLDVPFVFSSNGDGFVEHDRTGKAKQPERHLKLDEFPSPEELWRRYCDAKGIKSDAEKVVTQEYYADGSGKSARYYQLNAVNKVIEAVARGQNRCLLVMATGTGKTYTAFQIIWRLWKSGAKKRILFLADRNILVDQTMVNDFRPFKGAMAKLSTRSKTIERVQEGKVVEEEIDLAINKRTKQVNTAYEIYLSLYQSVSGTEEEKNVYKQFSPTFFDLIIVDECHRGSAAENSAWRDILEYFSTATQIGLTATPKETADVSTSHYFGDAVYTYSLRQGIEDGFLAPYKVVRFDLDKDLEGWRPSKGAVDKHGKEIEDRIYNQSDFDRHLVLEKRTELVAKKVSDFLKATDRMSKTIVFCEDVDHAERMRQALVNENGDLVNINRKYVMRITGDNAEGKAELDNFIHPEEKYPVIATTSKLMSTGVDAQTCKVIVLDQTIKSMTEFKQIIGRGTRIREDQGKLFFTILDFKRATELFADPDFDGEPVRIYNPGPDDPPSPPDDDTELGGTDGGEPQKPPPEPPVDDDDESGDGEGGKSKRVKYVVGDVPVHVIKERVQYYGRDGKLITESLKDYSKKAVIEEYKSLEEFLKRWQDADRKKAVVDELLERGVFFDELAQEVGRDCSPFDLVCHVAFGQPPLTRKERANNVMKRDYFTKFGEKARAVLEAILAKYADEGVEDIADIAVLRVAPITKLGTVVEIVQAFGGKDAYLKAVHELETELYAANSNKAS